MVTSKEEQARIRTEDLMQLADWRAVRSYEDITYHKAEGIARIAFDRPDIRNAFRPKTIDEMTEAVLQAWHDGEVGVLWITANGPSRQGRRLVLLRRRRSKSARAFWICRRRRRSAPECAAVAALYPQHA